MGSNNLRWYQGITAYQWLVLVIASLGWVFDVFEGQIFVASMNEAMPALLPASVQFLGEEARKGYVAYYNNITLGSFLVGGALGGVFFGYLSDRIGRTRTMILTILMYSFFTLVSAWSWEWWHMAVFRFLVAMGVGGEWAVASALVAEVFPKRARAWSGAIFHSSSVFGTILALAAGYWIVSKGVFTIALPFVERPWTVEAWRVGFLLGALPAALIIWVRLSLREPETWQQARSETRGSFAELLSSRFLGKTLLGVGLAAIGLATFWGSHIYGKDLMRHDVESQCLAEILAQATTMPPSTPEEVILEEVRSQGGGPAVLRQRLKHPEGTKYLESLLKHYRPRIKQGEMFGMLLVTVGGGLGLVCFGPISDRLGRRGAFLVFLLGGLLVTIPLFQLITGMALLTACLPIFGFWTLGMHAGFAIYFPELYPTRLRSTGGGFCFNVGRIVAAPILFLSGWMQRDWGFSLEDAATILSLLFPLGALLLLFAPETKGRELPE